MAKIPQRRFLLKGVNPLKKYFQEGALFVKKYNYKDKISYVYDFEDKVFTLEEYKKVDKDLKILVLISDKDESLSEKLQTLEEVTDDKRYSSKYLKRFGNPVKYSFLASDVFKKCDSVGSSKLELHFTKGMDSVKVFQVLLYRLNQLFLLNYKSFLENSLDFEVLKDSHVKLKTFLQISKSLFHKKTIKTLLDDFGNLYLLLNHRDKIDRFNINFKSFINDTDRFYTSKKDFSPIYNFIKKQIKNIIILEKKKLDSLYNLNMYKREFVTILHEISNIMLYFTCIFNQDEINEINNKIQNLKKTNLK